MLILLYLILAALGVGFAWRLSDYDTGINGDNSLRDLLRRVLRIVATLILLAILFGLPPANMAGGYGFVPLLLIIPTSIGLIWCGCISEWWSHAFRRLLYPDEKSHHYDPGRETRELSRVAHLLKNGQREHAIRLSDRLAASGEASVLVLETMLAQAGIEWLAPRQSDPLVQANRLRLKGNYPEAEKALNALLVKNPSNVPALLMLIRLYAHDLGRPEKAGEIVRRLEGIPHIPSWHVEHARHVALGRGDDKTVPEEPVVLPESIEELLAQGYSGTAIEILEQKIKEQPGDFDSWLKLAEAQGFHCHNFRVAEKIVQKMETSRLFTADQIQLAKTKLAAWRAARSLTK